MEAKKGWPMTLNWPVTVAWILPIHMFTPAKLAGNDRPTNAAELIAQVLVTSPKLNVTSGRELHGIAHWLATPDLEVANLDFPGIWLLENERKRNLKGT